MTNNLILLDGVARAEYDLGLWKDADANLPAVTEARQALTRK